MSLTLTWSENCVLTNITTQTARDVDPNDPNADPPVEARPEIKAPISEKFKITDTKLYVPVVTLSQKMIIIFYNN